MGEAKNRKERGLPSKRQKALEKALEKAKAEYLAYWEGLSEEERWAEWEAALQKQKRISRVHEMLASIFGMGVGISGRV